MADDRDAVYREIDSELRREQLAKLWDRYGIYAIVAAAVIVVGVGGFKWMEARNIAAAEAAGARYEATMQLLAQGKTDEAQQTLDSMARDAPEGYATLAKLQLASKAAAKNPAEALAIYEKLAADGSADPLFREFAQLQSAALKLDTADFTEMQNRLTPLSSASSPWRYSARELLGLAAFRAGRLDEARQTLLELMADQNTPPTMRERANLLMGLITAAEAAPAAPSAQPAVGTAAPAASPKVQ